MYRSLLLPLVCLTFASAAPQDSSTIPSSSNITYVKIDPLPTSETEPETETSFPLPFQFPANHRKSKTLEFVDTGNEENTSVVFDNEVNDEETQSDSDKYVILHSEATTINFESGETKDVTTVATERERKPSTFRTITEGLDFPTIRTTLPPRFIPKTSYYSKRNSNDRSLSTANHVEKRITLRKFRSKCRCEKIWNCPKLQITVPRCPNEYFLCCF